MPKLKRPAPRGSKEAAPKRALREDRKVLWLDPQTGKWHVATDRRNTPHYATETENVKDASYV